MLHALLGSVCLITAAYADWPVFGYDAEGHRHVPYTQITAENVAQLELAFVFDTGLDAAIQATPIVQDGVLFLSLPFNHVVALDAQTGDLLWRYTHTRRPDRALCCGPANRGVAVDGGTVFQGTVDGRLIALDAASGALLWDQDVLGDDLGQAEDVAVLAGAVAGNASGASGAGINMAPAVFENLVIIGITGVGYGLHLDAPDRQDTSLGAVVGIAGQYGRTGFLAAYDRDTGAPVWHFDTIKAQGWEGDFTAVTADGVVLPRDLDQERRDLPKYPDAARFGGGSAWSTPVIDAEHGRLFFGVGNPSPQMEASSRPGDNLYTASLVALDARTGAYLWHYQQVPSDRWGYDVASPPVLFSFAQGNTEIPAVGQASKTGWFYAHDRRTGALLYKSEAFVPQHQMFQTATPEGLEVFPGVMGGVNWSPVSIDAHRQALFVPAVHWPVVYQMHERPATETQAALRYSTMSPSETAERYGLLTRIDLRTGQRVWQHRTEQPLVGGVMSTASGLVWVGEGQGQLTVLHADTGAVLWQAPTPAGANAPPVSYTVDGQQYVAIGVGGNPLFGFPTGRWLYVWRLPISVQ